ncbi:MAG: ATP-binding protein, partial [Rhizobiaceae bacterium]
MPITKANLDDVVEADLQELIDSAVPESLTLEFKRDMYAGNEAGRKEFLKDLSSFTNSSGGHLILGMDEDQGYASAIAAIKGNPDQTIQ